MVNYTRTPAHFWIVAILGLVWFSGGAYDYVMTAYNNEDYLSILTTEQRAWMDMRPTWFTAAWAISTWSSVVGCLLMLIRKRGAGNVFLLSLTGYIPCVIWSYLLATPTAYAVTGMFGAVFSAVIFVTIVFFITYCANMAQRGVLR